jgi:transposase-like protein
VAPEQIREIGPQQASSLVGVLADSLWIEMPLGAAWTVAYRLVPQQGQPVVAELRVFPTEPDRRAAGEWTGCYTGVRATVPAGGLTAPMLRRIRLHRNLVAGKHAIAWVARHTAVPVLGRFGLAQPKVRGERRQPHRGRPGWSRAEYARIAAAYVSAIEHGSTRPVADVARRRRLEPSQARDAVRRARELGLLTPGVKRGQVGGALTPAAIRLLKGGGK